MKLIIQIPCYNEERTLPVTLSELPGSIPGVDRIETLVVDDGSEDGTVRVARACGVDHLVELNDNRGLASAWAAGMEHALKAGADIIVNTDADNQYRGEDVRKLVWPILEGRADMVIGERPIEQIPHFSWLKKRLQRLGSRVVSLLAGVDVPDAASGFRAYDREAAFAFNLDASYSHCMETIIRAAHQGIRITSVPIRTNEKLRESRLRRSIFHYVCRQGVDILHAFASVQPMKVFLLAALVFFLPGLAGFVRFLVYYFRGSGGGHVQSLIFSAVLIIVASLVGLIGLTSHMISANRQLLEEILCRLRRLEVEQEKETGQEPEAISIASEGEKAA